MNNLSAAPPGREGTLVLCTRLAMRLVTRSKKFLRNGNLLTKHGHSLPELLQRYHKETSHRGTGYPFQGLLTVVNAL